LKRLAHPLYIAAGSAEEALILDRAMHGVYQSYWSIPFFWEGRLTGLIQFGFPKAYRWLPRELDLLNAFAERCLRGAERARLMQDLASREEQVRSLAAHLLRGEEEERRRISRELHDEAGQSLLFLRLHLEMLEKSAPAGMQAKLSEARGVAERIIGEIRRIIAALHPSAVEELGLAAAIRHLSARFRKLYPMQLRLRLKPYEARLSREIETTIYRVVQECYQNIGKHSGASRVNLLMIRGGAGGGPTGVFRTERHAGAGRVDGRPLGDPQHAWAGHQDCDAFADIRSLAIDSARVPGLKKAKLAADQRR